MENEIEVGDIISAFGFLVAACALFFTAYEIRRNVITTKANFIMGITERYFSNDDVRKLYYRLDYRDWTFEWKSLNLAMKKDGPTV